MHRTHVEVFMGLIYLSRLLNRPQSTSQVEQSNDIKTAENNWKE